MTPYATLIGDIPEEMHKDLMNRACDLLDSIPDRSKKDPVTCHEVCSDWITQDHPGEHEVGLYLEFFDHSWIRLPGNIIIDLYPVGGVHPVIRRDTTPSAYNQKKPGKHSSYHVMEKSNEQV